MANELVTEHIYARSSLPPSDVLALMTDTSRRDLLHWLGRGCVLALGADLLAACQGPPATHPDSSPLIDAGPAGDTSPVGDAGDAAFPFGPGGGDLPIFEGWPIRTVDVHDLSKILANWSLSVGGMVKTPRTFTFADLLQLQRRDMLVDFHCVEGWSVYDVPWNGLHLSDLFAEVEPTSAATHVSFFTFDEKYNESLPMEVALEPKTLLSYGVGGSTLPFTHGFPLRLVVPRLYAYKSAKYVTRIELTDEPMKGFWVAAGYGYDAKVPDARLREGKY
ncbi:MAG: molybdopterin-dependent oxidoreductase [Deltaproteobacteria bacterium]|nr:molybdopterin-dependent oxidoreductase [Deltaproteobacteria bacterium]